MITIFLLFTQVYKWGPVRIEMVACLNKPLALSCCFSCLPPNTRAQSHGTVYCWLQHLAWNSALTAHRFTTSVCGFDVCWLTIFGPLTAHTTHTLFGFFAWYHDISPASFYVPFWQIDFKKKIWFHKKISLCANCFHLLKIYAQDLHSFIVINPPNTNWTS